MNKRAAWHWSIKAWQLNILAVERIGRRKYAKLDNGKRKQLPFLSASIHVHLALFSKCPFHIQLPSYSHRSLISRLQPPPHPPPPPQSPSSLGFAELLGLRLGFGLRLRFEIREVSHGSRLGFELRLRFGLCLRFDTVNWGVQLTFTQNIH